MKNLSACFAPLSVLPKMTFLFFCIMCASSLIVSALWFLPIPVTLTKAIVDLLLWTVNYKMQRIWVFKDSNRLKRTPKSKRKLIPPETTRAISVASIMLKNICDGRIYANIVNKKGRLSYSRLMPSQISTEFCR